MKHSGLLEHWLLWQAADFCVAHRLRTPIGKPMETFTCIELAIKQIVADTRVEVSPKCGGKHEKVGLECHCVLECYYFVHVLLTINCFCEVISSQVISEIQDFFIGYSGY